jgi:hypothetical protein
MKDDRQNFTIPLMSFSSPLERWPLEIDGQETEFISVRKVREDEITKGCYGVKIADESMAPVLRPGMVAVFSQNGSYETAHGDIFSIGRKGELPVVRKVVKSDIHSDGKADSGKGRVRKSFMTPTPLHIPKSRVSPIADSTHQMIYYKGLAETEALTLLPAGNLLWMHPLVLILPEDESD